MEFKIDRENLFRKKLDSGIVLFTGSGFSCLPDAKGYHLPVGNELCDEICSSDKFSIPEGIKQTHNLETISEIIGGIEYQNFLRNRFTVSGYNSNYDLINRLSLKAYITTNIDNIIQLAIKNGGKYYLKSLTYYGASHKNKSELCYIPLHGEVSNTEFPLYFGKFDLAVVDEANKDLFTQMYTKLQGNSVLFWGYGFHDSGVLKIVSRHFKNHPQDIWIQCRADDIEQIETFKSLGCNIIVSDTEQLFKWINDNIPEQSQNSEKSIGISPKLSKYFIPSIEDVPAVPSEDYYRRGITQWYSILTKQAIELDTVNEIYDASIDNKNVIFVGTDYSGKTTSLMQLALKCDFPNKLFINSLIPSEANLILSQLNGDNVTIFFDNCAADMEAYKILAQSQNVRTIATCSDYSFEISKHMLIGVPFKHIEVGELTEQQARRFYNDLQPGIKCMHFSYKSTSSEKFSVLEMMLSNVFGIMKSQRVKDMLERILASNQQVFDVVALAVYLSSCDSALSTDIMFAYFNVNYDNQKKLIDQANGFLHEENLSIQEDEDDQDYYLIRSNLFLLQSAQILRRSPVLKAAYGAVIRKFIFKVSPYVIFRYYQYRRKAYDANLFYDVFYSEANDIYSYLYSYDKNPYTLQQLALYKSRLGDYKSAFADIDKAIKKVPNNFSMKNSRAIILFESNRNSKEALAVEKSRDAMDILEECYKNDRRKVYHAQKYAEFAIYFATYIGDTRYIEKANKWIEEIINKEESNSKTTRDLKHELSMFL